MLSKEKKTENIFKSLLTLIEISLRFFLSFFSRDNRYPRFCFFSDIRLAKFLQIAKFSPISQGSDVLPRRLVWRDFCRPPD